MAPSDARTAHAEPLQFLDIAWMIEHFEWTRGGLDAHKTSFGQVAQQG
ncbi:MAG: hypothetical protein J0M19_13400 [Sphingomonadales bacterium]|nr:hypothetical protein [Sphingomonadales bacterium]